MEPVPRFLRKVTLYAFPASFLFFIVSSFGFYSIFPILSLANIALSSALALFVLHHESSPHSPSPDVAAGGSSARSKSKIARKDCILAIGHFINLFITFFRLFNGYRGMDEAILTAYCTVFIIVDLAIHIYFCAHSFRKFVFARVCSCQTCRGPPAYTQQLQHPLPAARHASPGGSTERKTIIEFDTDDETMN